MVRPPPFSISPVKEVFVGLWLLQIQWLLSKCFHCKANLIGWQETQGKGPPRRGIQCPIPKWGLSQDAAPTQDNTLASGQGQMWEHASPHHWVLTTTGPCYVCCTRTPPTAIKPLHRGRVACRKVGQELAQIPTPAPCQGRATSHEGGSGAYNCLRLSSPPNTEQLRQVSICPGPEHKWLH